MNSEDARSGRLAVVTDADACLPAGLRDELGIRLAPAQPDWLQPRTEPRDLRAQQAPAAFEPIVEACLDAARHASAVLYVASGDRYGAPEGATDDVAARMLAERPDVPFRALDSDATLMGCGWQALAAARAAEGAAPDAWLEHAAAEAARVGRAVQVLAMLEYPQFMDIPATLPGSQATGGRAIVALRGADAEVLDRPPRRDAALAMLCEQARAATAGAGALRVAVHHGAVEPAGRALATWVERELGPAEVHLTPLTHHAATRIGPRSLVLAWYRDAQ